MVKHGLYVGVVLNKTLLCHYRRAHVGVCLLIFGKGKNKGEKNVKIVLFLYFFVFV